MLLLVGVAVLSVAYHVGATEPGRPGYQSVLSQLTAAVVGRGAIYYVTVGSIVAVLCLSANTSFADFPRLCRVLAMDGFLPPGFAHQGARLVYSMGIVLLAFLAGVLLVVFGGLTDRLIPLFAVGAFLAFTMSQLGMVAHWMRQPPPRRRLSLAVNAVGARRHRRDVDRHPDLQAGRGRLDHAAAAGRAAGDLPPRGRAPGRRRRGRAGHRRAGSVADAAPDGAGSDEAAGSGRAQGAAFRADDHRRRDGRAAAGRKPGRRGSVRVRGRRASRSRAARPACRSRSWSSFARPIAKCWSRWSATSSGWPAPTRAGPIVVIVPEVVHARWYHAFLHSHTSTLLKALLVQRGGPQVLVVSAPWYADRAARERARRRRRARRGREAEWTGPS